ncbi:MAG: trehalose 6-phosphate synthase [Acidobacteriota bacterium]|jgi:trehalose 6-phosphate synthase|nr:trehalose 6-phosphate synthase [Acidobacteriota bacterium]
MNKASTYNAPAQRLPELPPAPSPQRRVLVMSDRLPIQLTREGGEGWRADRVHGSLVAALNPVLRERRGVWIGWPGVAEDEAPDPRVVAGAIQAGGSSMRPVSLRARDVRGAYDGFGGEIIWPLFHEQPMECRFDPAAWQAYRRVNRKFARAAAKAMSASDLLWVHNHLLMNVAAELRTLRVPCRTAFFLHLPFPGPDLFLKLPWRERLLRGLLAYDQLGFQTPRDLQNFLDCAHALGVSQDIRANAFPIGVDFHSVAERAGSPEIGSAAARLRELHGGRSLILGIDRLDRSKGISEKLRAFAELLARRPELHDRVSLIQVVVPSREDLPRHRELGCEIARQVGEINGRFSRPGWIPVHFLQRTLTPDELLAHYRAADVALITPLREGMNLVAKEYCAARVDEQGTLVLSEFAGAAVQLGQGALLVNPHNATATARTLHKALRMAESDRGRRMRSLREEVRRHDIFWWAESFLARALDEGPERTLRLERTPR